MTLKTGAKANNPRKHCRRPQGPAVVTTAGTPDHVGHGVNSCANGEPTLRHHGKRPDDHLSMPSTLGEPVITQKESSLRPQEGSARTADALLCHRVHRNSLEMGFKRRRVPESRERASQLPGTAALYPGQADGHCPAHSITGTPSPLGVCPQHAPWHLVREHKFAFQRVTENQPTVRSHSFAGASDQGYLRA